MSVVGHFKFFFIFFIFFIFFYPPKHLNDVISTFGEVLEKLFFLEQLLPLMLKLRLHTHAQTDGHEMGGTAVGEGVPNPRGLRPLGNYTKNKVIYYYNYKYFLFSLN